MLNIIIITVSYIHIVVLDIISKNQLQLIKSLLIRKDYSTFVTLVFKILQKEYLILLNADFKFLKPAEFTINIQVKIVLAVTGLHNFIQLLQITEDIYDKTQVYKKYLLIYLSQEENIIDLAIHISTNTSRRNKAQINQF